MNFIFIGYDYTLDIAINLMEDGHDLIGIKTFPCDNIFAFNTQIKDFANAHQIPISEEKITPQDIVSDIARGATLFLCAGYPYKIPDIDEKHAYAINMHPTYLPHARGKMPLPHIILSDPKGAGFTLHKITSSFDCGDIIYQEHIGISKNTDVETLSAQIAIRAQIKIPYIISNIEQYWKSATPQDHSKASYAPLPDEIYRTINWNQTASYLSKQSKAFGRFGMIGHVKNNIGQTQTLGIFQFSTWEESHNWNNGTLMRSGPKEIVIAIKDGFICLKDFLPINELKS